MEWSCPRARPAAPQPDQGTRTPCAREPCGEGPVLPCHAHAHVITALFVPRRTCSFFFALRSLTRELCSARQALRDPVQQGGVAARDDQENQRGPLRHHWDGCPPRKYQEGRKTTKGVPACAAAKGMALSQGADAARLRTAALDSHRACAVAMVDLTGRGRSTLLFLTPLRWQ